jgi:hypothetical protein
MMCKPVINNPAHFAKKITRIKVTPKFPNYHVEKYGSLQLSSVVAILPLLQRTSSVAVPN